MKRALRIRARRVAPVWQGTVGGLQPRLNLAGRFFSGLNRDAGVSAERDTGSVPPWQPNVPVLVIE
jgi:hypothetical protein